MEKCTKCGSEDIVGVEMMGAYDGVIMWECLACGNKTHRATGKTIVSYSPLNEGEKYGPVFFTFDDGLQAINNYLTK